MCYECTPNHISVSCLIHEFRIDFVVQEGRGVDHAIASGRLGTFQDAVNHHMVVHAWEWLAVTHHLTVQVDAILPSVSDTCYCVGAVEQFSTGHSSQF